MKRFIISVMSLLAFLANLNKVDGQIKLQIKYTPNWIIFDDTTNLAMARSKVEWSNLNRKNFPAVISESGRYNYNWFALSSGVLKLPKGYKYASLQDFNDFGKYLFKENFKHLQSVPIWVYEYDASQNELAQQIVSEKNAKSPVLRWKVKSDLAQIALIEDEIHFYNNVFKDSKFEELADECAEAADVLNENLRSYFQFNLKSFIRDGQNYFIKYKGEVRFNGVSNNFSKNIELQSSYSHTDELISKINSEIDNWATINFPVHFDSRLNKEFRISTYQPIDIEVFNVSEEKVINQKKIGRLKFYNYPIANVDNINIPKGYINALKYSYTESTFKINVQDRNIIDSTFCVLKEFRLNNGYKFKPLLSLIGCANTKDKTLSKWFYTTIAITGVAHLTQKAFYSRYLKNPNERQGAYTFANNFYKLKLLGGLSIGTMILFDAGIAFKKYNKTRRLVRSLNIELQNMVWQ